MSALLTPTAGAIALGVATLERLLGSEDERVALKAAELLLRLHPDLKKPRVEDDPQEEPPLAPAAVAPPVHPPERAEVRTPTKPAPNPAARKMLLAPLNGSPASPRSFDPLPASVLGGSRPLTSFTNLPKSSPSAPG